MIAGAAIVGKQTPPEIPVQVRAAGLQKATKQ